MKRLRAIDLCCGAGGWACAARGLPIEFVAVADLAPDCLATWKLNHSADHSRCKLLHVDLSTREGVEMVLESIDDEPIDLAVGGIPCEVISQARPNKASHAVIEKWHELLANVLGLVRELEPPYWAIEDVIQIEKHIPGPLLCGIDVPFQRIDASRFGPQRRIRTFLGAFPTPTPESGPRTVGEILRPGPYATEPDIEKYRPIPKGGDTGQRVGKEFMRVLDPSKPSYTIMGALGRGGRHRRSFMIETDDGRYRRLTWQEAATLQGFPDDYIFAGCPG